MDLPLIWIVIIAFVVLMYVICDGFNLGVGILFPWMHRDDRPLAMTTVSPVWDGNETWLVMGAAMLYGAFPIAYSTVLPALYLPLILMVLALIFRGISFEFLFKVEGHRKLWDVSFSAGSYMAVFCQGIVLGTIVQGPTDPGLVDFSKPFYWLSAFSIISGFGLMAGYAYLGSAWLIVKTEARLQEWSYKAASRLMFAFIASIIIVSIWTPFVDPFVMKRWFGSTQIFLLLSIVPLITMILFSCIFYELRRKKHERRPFLFGIGIFVLAFIGLGISSYPYIVPHVITFRQAASNHMTLFALFIATAIILPLILFYFGYSYYVFRGKVKSAHELH